MASIIPVVQIAAVLTAAILTAICLLSTIKTQLEHPSQAHAQPSRDCPHAGFSTASSAIPSASSPARTQRARQHESQ